MTTNTTCWGTAQRYLEATTGVSIHFLREIRHVDDASQGYGFVANPGLLGRSKQKPVRRGYRRTERTVRKPLAGCREHRIDAGQGDGRTRERCIQTRTRRPWQACAGKWEPT